MAPWVGFEPTTARLTVESSTAELPRNNRPVIQVAYRAVCIANFTRMYSSIFAFVIISRG